MVFVPLVFAIQPVSNRKHAVLGAFTIMCDNLLGYFRCLCKCQVV